MAAENKQYKHANKLLICDTDLLETMVYSEYYYAGFCPDDVKVYAYKNSYDLYFLSYIDVVWKADGIRDQPEHRGQLFNRFEQALIDSKKPYVVVKGEFEERLNFCKAQIKNLLKDTY
jgi:nicotinamide riboside kinase